MAIIERFENLVPTAGARGFLASTATLIGDVSLGDDVTIMYGAVLRGDVMPIRIGRGSNIQDNSVLHTTTGVSQCLVGDEVTVGHRVILHGCEIHDRVLIGMGATVLDLAVIETGVLLAAGSLVTPRTRLPAGYLCRGSPAKAIRPVNDAERAMIEDGWRSYVDLGRRYAASSRSAT